MEVIKVMKLKSQNLSNYFNRNKRNAKEVKTKDLMPGLFGNGMIKAE